MVPEQPRIKTAPNDHRIGGELGKHRRRERPRRRMLIDNTDTDGDAKFSGCGLASAFNGPCHTSAACQRPNSRLAACHQQHVDIAEQGPGLTNRQFAA